MRKLIMMVFVLALAACGQATDAVNSDATPAKVQAETAKYFSTTSRNVRVGSFEQTLLGTKYRAKIGSRTFNCHYIRSTVSCQNA
ncbi:MAG: hypothetical protein AAF718_05620 [Pseudomonadota bacterium]